MRGRESREYFNCDFALCDQIPATADQILIWNDNLAREGPSDGDSTRRKRLVAMDQLAPASLRPDKRRLRMRSKSFEIASCVTQTQTHRPSDPHTHTHTH